MQGSNRVPVPRKPDEEDPDTDRALTAEQVAAIIDDAPERYRLLIRVVAMTGMRRSEALGLRWKDIDHEAGVVKIRRRLYKGDVGPPKSKTGKRSIPIPDALIPTWTSHGPRAFTRMTVTTSSRRPRVSRSGRTTPTWSPWKLAAAVLV